MTRRFAKALPLSATICLCCLPALALAAFMVWGRVSDIRQASEDELIHTAAAYADRLEHEIGTVKLISQQLAGRLSTSEDWAFITEAAKLMALPTGYNIVVHRADGEQIYNAQYPILHSGSQLRDSGTIDRTMVMADTVVSDLIVSPYTSEFRAAVSTPVMKQGKVAGVVSITFASDYLASVMGQRGLRNGRRWVVSDAHGLILAKSSRLKVGLGEHMADNVFEQITAGDSGLAWVTPSNTQIPIIGAWHRIAGSDWSVTVIMYQSEVLDRISGLLLWFIAMLAGTGIMVAYAALELTGNKQQPEGAAQHTPPDTAAIPTGSSH